MRTSTPRASQRLCFTAFSFAILLMASSLADAGQKRAKKAQSRPEIPSAKIGTQMAMRDAVVVRAGFQLAYEKVIEEPACGALFTELSLDGPSALGSTSYSLPRPGLERGRCDRGVLAVTRKGSTEIRLCPKLWNLAKEGVAAILIHEALHTAGLGEWPEDPAAPTSAAITRSVLKACSLN